MGRWLELLQANAATPIPRGTDRTDGRVETEPSVGFVSASEGGCASNQAAGDGRAVGVDRTLLASVAWSDGDIQRFLEHQARLLGWGWSDADAKAAAERLVLRDRVGDERVSCIECASYRPGRCANYRKAGLVTSKVGQEVSAMLQHCLGFTPAILRCRSP